MTALARCTLSKPSHSIVGNHEHFGGLHEGSHVLAGLKAHSLGRFASDHRYQLMRADVDDNLGLTFPSLMDFTLPAN